MVIITGHNTIYRDDIDTILGGGEALLHAEGEVI